jgi:hypothetical protein
MQDYVLQDNKRCYDKILSDWNFRLPSLGFKCILVGLMNMIDGMQFWTPRQHKPEGRWRQLPLNPGRFALIY